jgi:hypothetical protein
MPCINLSIQNWYVLKHFHTGKDPNLRVSLSLSGFLMAIRRCKLASRCEAAEETGSHSRQAQPETITELLSHQFKRMVKDKA